MKKSYLFVFGLVCCIGNSMIAMDSPAPTKSFSDSEKSPQSTRKTCQKHTRLKRSYSDATFLSKSQKKVLLASLASKNPIKRVKNILQTERMDPEMLLNTSRKIDEALNPGFSLFQGPEKSNTPAKKLDIQKRMASKQMQLTEQWYENAQQEAS